MSSPPQRSRDAGGAWRRERPVSREASRADSGARGSRGPAASSSDWQSDRPWTDLASQGRRLRGEPSYHGGSKGHPRIYEGGRWRRATSTEAARMMPRRVSQESGLTGPRQHDTQAAEWGPAERYRGALWQQHLQTGWWQRVDDQEPLENADRGHRSDGGSHNRNRGRSASISRSEADTLRDAITMLHGEIRSLREQVARASSTAPLHTPGAASSSHGAHGAPQHTLGATSSSRWAHGAPPPPAPSSRYPVTLWRDWRVHHRTDQCAHCCADSKTATTDSRGRHESVPR